MKEKKVGKKPHGMVLIVSVGKPSDKDAKDMFKKPEKKVEKGALESSFEDLKKQMVPEYAGMGGKSCAECGAKAGESCGLHPHRVEQCQYFQDS